MSPAAHRPSSRDRLLDAGVQIVTAQGVQALTLEAVAAAAGVTKGGLIYHFKTRDELLAALVERLAAQLEQRYRDKAAARGRSVADLLSAMIEESFDLPEEERQLMSHLLAAAASHPQLLGPAQRMFGRAYADFEAAGADAGLALLLAAAMDGLVMLELTQVHQFSESQRRVMRAALQDLIAPLRAREAR